MRLSTRHKVNAAFGVALLILGAVSWISFRSTVALARNGELQLHTHQRIQALDRLSALLREAESGQRGFLLTGRDEYLEPYHRAGRLLDGQLQTVRPRAGDGPERRARMERVERLVAEKRAEMAETIRLRRAEGLGAAVGVVGTDRGREAMQEIRILVEEIEQDVQAELERQGAVVRADARRTLRAIPLAGVFALLVVGVAGAGIHRNLTESERAARALRKSEERFRRLVEQAADAILVHDADGVMLHVNQAACAMYGYPEETLLSMRLHELSTVGDADRYKSVLRALVDEVQRTGQVATEGWSRRRDGTQFPIEARIGLFDPDPERPLLVGIVRDVTERKRAEEELQDAHEALRALVEASPLAIVSMDPEGRVVHWNPAAEQTFGWKAGEVVGKPAPFIPEELREEQAEHREQVLAGRGISGVEVVRVRSDGTRITVGVSTAPIRGADGRVRGIMSINEDVTDRKRAAEELQRKEERFRSLIENATDVIAILDADGVIRYESPALERVLGFQVHEMVGTNSFDSIHPDDQPHVMEKFAHALEQPGRVISLEYRFRHRDGSWRYLESSGQNLLDHPAVGGIVVNSRDITERKVAEAALAAQARELRRSNQELEQFAYVASHDLQEPLRKIQAFGDRLGSRYAEVLGEQGADYVQRMQSAAGRMQVLIQDLLSFSRVGTKAQPFTDVRLGEVADEVISDLQTRVQTTGGRVELGALPAVHADRTQIRQLMQNLVGNALKFHREGVPPVVRIESRAVGGNGSGAPPAVEVRVTDNGIGFDEKYLDRIFDPFQRLHGRMEFEGTGMGLAICRKIVERHGGGITARSTPGVGTTFIVTLPAPGAEGAQ